MRVLDATKVLSVCLVLGFGGAAQDARSAPTGLEARASSSIAPSAVANPRRFRIAAGGGHTCALTKSNGLKCWGSNYYGELGDGTRVDRHTAVPTKGLASGLVSVTAGTGHTCVLTKTGGVKCWGQNTLGQLGDGVGLDRYTPGFVKGLTSGALAVVSNGLHTCAITGVGGVKCWGDNSAGQLGDGTRTQRLAPVSVKGLTKGVIAIAAGTDHTCARTTANLVKCWGRNDHGQLGDGTTTDRLTPVAVKKLADIVFIAASAWPATCALTKAGVPLCWGFNLIGELGDGTTTDRHTPIRVTGLAGGVKTIALGGLHTCALSNSGSVECWGDNNSGQLGNDDDNRRNRYVPTHVHLTVAATALTAGFAHTCAVTSVGGVMCWGEDYEGELGDGMTVDEQIPVSVKGF
jgi:alpha-tubulin suppressor-like RCC1 family protein